MTFSHEPTTAELLDWVQWYLPPKSLAKDSLILIVGAKDGLAALFFLRHGWTNLRLMESSPVYHYDLIKNRSTLEELYTAKVDIITRQFELGDLTSVAFALFDTEQAIDLEGLTIPWASQVYKTVKSGDTLQAVSISGFRRSEGTK